MRLHGDVWGGIVSFALLLFVLLAAVVQFMLNVVQVWCGCDRNQPLRCSGSGLAHNLGVCCQPESTGIGGGCMPMVYTSSDGMVRAFDAREEAPAAFSEDAFCADAACTSATKFFPDRASGGKNSELVGSCDGGGARGVRGWGGGLTLTLP